MNALRKIISGGQTGVDQAALRAAQDCGMETGGWCPPGRVCEAGVIPAEFPLKETLQERSADAPDVPRSQRTEWNVRDSDGTLVVERGGNRSGCALSGGVAWTMECATRYKRPLLVCYVHDREAGEKIREWIEVNRIATLNVAGPSESNAPGLGARAYDVLRPIFDRGKFGQDLED
jgi:hypothetical protein